MFIVFIVAAIGLVILVAALAYLGWKQEQERRAGVAALAQARGWRYSDDRNRQVAGFFSFLDRLSSGHSDRYATDVIEGQWQGWTMMAFNHHAEDIDYRTDSDGNSDRDVTTYWNGVVAFQLPLDRPLPELTVEPEGIFGRLIDTFTNRDIDFPHAPEFSKAYKVHCADRQLAADVCNPQMMQYLMANPKTCFEIEGQWVATVTSGKFDDVDLDRRLTELDELARHLPHYMVAQRQWPNVNDG